VVDVQNQGAAADTPLAAAGGERRPVIEARGLTKRYGRHTAVAGLDLTIYEGEVFGLLGPNGAGKTTTILMLLGLTEPTAGSVRVLGWDPARDPIEVKRAVGYLPENIGFYDDMTGRENLLYTARLNGLPERDAQERIDSLLTAVGLEGAGDRLVRVYSRGMRQRLGLADVLVKRPRMIILDEPTLGIDPAGIEEILRLIARLAAEERVTVLISSHLLHQVQRVCNRVGIFVGGRLIAAGTVDELSRQLARSAPFVVTVEVQDGDPGRVESVLGRVEGVAEVERDGTAWRVHCREDVRSAIARALVDNGLALVRLSAHTYGLDDVYRSYFEGRATDGKRAPGQAVRRPA